MGNIFAMTEVEEKEWRKELQRDKEEFESLHLDCYKEFEYEHFTEFISSMEHYVQSYGHKNFIYEYVTEERLANWLYHETLFVVGYIEYLCNKHGLKEPESIQEYKDKKLDRLLFHRGVLTSTNKGLFSGVLREYKNAIPELLWHNIVLSTVGDVV